MASNNVGRVVVGALGSGVGSTDLTGCVDNITVHRQEMTSIVTPILSGRPEVTTTGRTIGKITVEMTLAQLDDVYRILPRLVAHVRCSPFVLLESGYVAEELGRCDLVVGGIIPVAVQKLIIRNSRDIPHGITARLHLVVFEYKPHEETFDPSPALIEDHLDHAMQMLGRKCGIHSIADTGHHNGQFSIYYLGTDKKPANELILHLPVDVTSGPEFAGATLQNVEVTIESRFAYLPLAGNQFATLQYTGGVMAFAQVDIINDRGAWDNPGVISKIAEVVSTQAIDAQRAQGKGLSVLGIRNYLFNVCGIYRVALTSSTMSPPPDGSGVPSNHISFMFVESNPPRTDVFSSTTTPEPINGDERGEMFLNVLINSGIITRGGVTTLPKQSTSDTAGSWFDKINPWSSGAGSTPYGLPSGTTALPRSETGAVLHDFSIAQDLDNLELPDVEAVRKQLLKVLPNIVEQLNNVIKNKDLEYRAAGDYDWNPIHNTKQWYRILAYADTVVSAMVDFTNKNNFGDGTTWSLISPDMLRDLSDHMWDNKWIPDPIERGVGEVHPHLYIPSAYTSVTDNPAFAITKEGGKHQHGNGIPDIPSKALEDYENTWNKVRKEFHTKEGLDVLQTPRRDKPGMPLLNKPYEHDGDPIEDYKGKGQETLEYTPNMESDSELIRKWNGEVAPILSMFDKPGGADTLADIRTQLLRLDKKYTKLIASMFGYNMISGDAAENYMLENNPEWSQTKNRLEHSLKIAEARHARRHGLRRCYPSVKIYINTDEEEYAELDDLISWASIVNVKIIRSRKIHAPLAIVTLADREGLLKKSKEPEFLSSTGIIEKGKKKLGEKRRDMFTKAKKELERMKNHDTVKGIYKELADRMNPDNNCITGKPCKTNSSSTTDYSDIDVANELASDTETPVLSDPHFEKPHRFVDKVFVHCSDSSNPNITAKDVDDWHRKRGWRGIGYHYFIRTDGTIEKGRDLERIPAAQRGHNKGTIAICVNGANLDDFTPEEFKSLRLLRDEIDAAYGNSITYHGHCEVSTKTCPVFDYRSVLEVDHAGRRITTPTSSASGTPSSSPSLKDTEPELKTRLKEDGIREGCAVQIRIGYSNDPDELTTYLNGSIVEVHLGEIVTIVVQGYAYELTNPLGVESPMNFGSFLQELVGEGGDLDKLINTSSPGKLRTAAYFGRMFAIQKAHLSATTADILTTLLNDPRHGHFGAWYPGSGNANRVEKFPGEARRNQFFPTRVGANVFAPNIFSDKAWSGKTSKKLMERFKSKIDDLFSPTVWFRNHVESPAYVINGQTFLDVADEMTLRHPGYIHSTRPYDNNETFFFGHPSFVYYASDRSPTMSPPAITTPIVDDVSKRLHKMMDKLDARAREISQYENQGAHTYAEMSRKIIKKMLYPRYKDIVGEMGERLATLIGVRDFYKNTLATRIKPFRNYHIVTSMHDIIKNDMMATGTGTYTEFVIGYQDGIGDMEDQKGRISQRLKGSERFSARIDDNLEESDVRTFYMDFGNCGGRWMAERYTLSLMQNSLKDIYQGGITCIGIEDLFPHDIVFIFDLKEEIVGAVGVEKVIQEFDLETGFTTTFTPDLIVDVNEVILDTTNLEVFGRFATDMMSRYSSWRSNIPAYTQSMLENMYDTIDNNNPDAEEQFAHQAVDVTKGATIASGVASAFTFSRLAVSAASGEGIIAGILGAYTLPITITLATLTALSGTYMCAKVGERVRWRQPIILTPVFKGNNPYLAGLNGYQYNTVMGSLKVGVEKLKLGLKYGITDAMTNYMKIVSSVNDVLVRYDELVAQLERQKEYVSQ